MTSIIRKFRKDLGMTMDELAQKVGITKGYLSRIENDSTKPSSDVLYKLIQALGLTDVEARELFLNVTTYNDTDESKDLIRFKVRNYKSSTWGQQKYEKHN